MRPDKYKLLSEDDSHFLVHDGESEFRVARDGLSPELQEKIKGFGAGALPESNLTGQDLAGPKPITPAPAAPEEKKKDDLLTATPPVEEVPIWKQIVRTGAPLVGGIVGGIYGGPVGAAAGSAGGGLLANAVTANQGGELSKYKMLEDGEEFYRLDDGKGEFKVAKKGLSKAMQDRVVQHFAGGGMVEPEAVPEFTLAPPAPMEVPQGMGGALFRADAGMPSTAIPPITVAPPGPGANAPPAYFSDQSGQVHEISSDSVGDAMEMGWTQAPPPATAPAPMAAPVPAPVAAPPPPVPMPLGTGGTGGASMPAMSSAPRMPNAQAELRAAEAVGMDAIQAQLVAQQAQAQEEARIREAAAIEAEARTKKFADINAAHQARGDKLYNDVLTGQINPNQLWESRTTGQKVASSIAIILSGIGQGLAGGPNMALAVLDRAIDRDIDAQKTNLQKKENALSQHMQMGRDMETAQRLVKADARDAIAGQIEAASAKFGDKKAVAGALAAVSAMKEKSAKERHEVAAKDMSLWLQRQQLEAERAKIAAAGKEAGAGPELFVPTANAFALDKDSAKEARAVGANHGSVTKNLDELIALREKYGSETIPGEASKRMTTLSGTVMGGANRFYKFGAMDKGTEKLLRDMMGGSASDYGYVLSGLKQLRASLDNERDAQYEAYLDPRSYKSMRVQPGEFGARKVSR